MSHRLLATQFLKVLIGVGVLVAATGMLAAGVVHILPF